MRIPKTLLISFLCVCVGALSGCANRNPYNPYPTQYPYQAYPYAAPMQQGQPGQQIQASPMVGQPPPGAIPPGYGAPGGFAQGSPQYMQPGQPNPYYPQPGQQGGTPFIGR